MVVFTGSEVDHTPARSTIKAQLPFTVDESENCTSFAGALALWSAVALSGMILVVIIHVSLEAPPHVAMNGHMNRRNTTQPVSRILRTAAVGKFIPALIKRGNGRASMVDRVPSLNRAQAEV
jgi:hypothetical protein